MARKLSINGDGQAIIHRMTHRESFDTYGNMSGDTTAGGWNGRSSWLKGSALEHWQADTTTVDYVVWSYWTPIVWHTPERGWVEIGHSFSPSSSRHASRARMGVHYDDDKRVTSLQVSYGLSDAQRMLLRRIANEKMPVRTTSIKGQTSRSLAVLYRFGLVQDNLNGYLTLTNKGREAWS